MRGYNLGNWMMLERFMFGFPGVDQLFRRFFLYHAGQEKYDAFFERYYQVYFQEKDAKFLSGMGCNVLRIPFNYRVFENDRRPFDFSPAPFKYIDRAIEFCNKYHIHTVIDYHAVQGYESGAHCCDNITGATSLYHDTLMQDRCVKLWEFIADHYKDNKNVIGFDLINEPYPKQDEIPSLLHLYRRLVKAVRGIDRTHLLFIEGGEMACNFNDFDEVFDDLMVHSPHYYINGPEYFAVKDPEGMRALVERDIAARVAMSRRLNIPSWFGETGLSIGPNQNEKLEYMDITLRALNERKISWSLWTFKDLYRMGLVSTAEDSEWRRRTKKFIDLKRKYNLDVSRYGDWDYTRNAFKDIDEDFPEKADSMKQALWNSTINAIAVFLAEDYAKLFAEQSIDVLYGMIDSFDLDNCIVKKDWHDIFHARMAE
jgi:hypothetical protein